MFLSFYSLSLHQLPEKADGFLRPSIEMSARVDFRGRHVAFVEMIVVFVNYTFVLIVVGTLNLGVVGIGRRGLDIGQAALQRLDVAEYWACWSVGKYNNQGAREGGIGGKKSSWPQGLQA